MGSLPSPVRSLRQEGAMRGWVWGHTLLGVDFINVQLTAGKDVAISMTWSTLALEFCWNIEL